MASTRPNGIQEVSGSIPLISTKESRNRKISGLFLLRFGSLLSRMQFFQITPLGILVYCRSGNRRKVVYQKLADLGYTNIVEFGGILN